MTISIFVVCCVVCCAVTVESLESTCSERERLLEKLQGFDGSERLTTEDDVRAKREQVIVASCTL